MDINELAAALSGADKEIEANNPYRGFQAVTGKVLHNPNDYSIGEDAIAGLVQGLLSGAAGNLGDTYSANAKKDYRDVLTGAIAGNPVTEADTSLSPSLFSKAKEAGSLFALKRAIDKQDAQTQMLNDIAKSRGTSAASELGKNDAKAIIAGNGVYDPTNDPDSPQYKTSRALEGDLVDVRKEFVTKPAYTDYAQSLKGFRTLVKAMKDPTGGADLDFAYGIVQMIEPGMAVREGEQAAVRNTVSLPEQLKGALLKAMNGEGSITPDIKRTLLEVAKRRMEEHSKQYNTAYDTLYGEAVRKKLPNPSAISYLPKAEGIDQIFKELEYDPSKEYSNESIAKEKSGKQKLAFNVDIPSLTNEAIQLKEIIKYGKPEDKVAANRRIQEIRFIVSGLK